MRTGAGRGPRAPLEVVQTPLALSTQLKCIPCGAVAARSSQPWAGSVLCSSVPASAIRAGSSAPDFPSLSSYRGSPQSVIEHRLPCSLICAQITALQTAPSVSAVLGAVGRPSPSPRCLLDTRCISSQCSEDEEGGAR